MITSTRNAYVTESLCVHEEDVEDSKAGSETIYQGKSSVLLCGVSSRKTPSGSMFELLNGTKVRVCTRPVIPFDGTKNPSPKVRIHYQVHVCGHNSNCSCGNCNRTFCLTNSQLPICECGIETYDEGEESCVVM